MSVQAPGRCSQKGTKVSANVLRRMPKQDSHPASKAQGWLASGCHLKLSLPTESQHAYHGKVSLEISHSTYAQSWVTFRHIPLGFEYFQGCRLYEQSGQPVPMFNNPHSKKKKKSVFLASNWKFLHFSWCLWLLLPHEVLPGLCVSLG